MSDREIPDGLARRLAASLPGPLAPVRPLPGIVARAVVLFAIATLAAALLGFGAGGKGWRVLDIPQRVTLVVPLMLLQAALAWDLSLRMVPGSRLRFPPAALLAMALAVIMF